MAACCDCDNESVAACGCRSPCPFLLGLAAAGWLFPERPEDFIDILRCEQGSRDFDLLKGHSLEITLISEEPSVLRKCHVPEPVRGVGCKSKTRMAQDFKKLILNWKSILRKSQGKGIHLFFVRKIKGGDAADALRDTASRTCQGVWVLARQPQALSFCFLNSGFELRVLAQIPVVFPPAGALAAGASAWLTLAGRGCGEKRQGEVVHMTTDSRSCGAFAGLERYEAEAVSSRCESLPLNGAATWSSCAELGGLVLWPFCSLSLSFLEAVMK